MQVLNDDDQSELHAAIFRLTGAVNRVVEVLDYSLDGKTDDCRNKLDSAKLQTERALKQLQEVRARLEGAPA